MTRTFDGRPFKLKEHVDRLYRSLRYLRIDPGLVAQGDGRGQRGGAASATRISSTADTDFWLGQRVSRGVDAVGDEGWEQTGPTVIVECIPLPLKARARLFRDGIDIVVPPIRRMPPDALSPRAKTHNYLNLILADVKPSAGPGGVVGAARQQRQPLRGHRQQHLPGARRRGADAAASASCCPGSAARP